MTDLDLFSLSAAERDDIALVEKFRRLHELLYVRGGIKPSSAAVEELAKLLLVQIAAEREPLTPVPGHGTLSGVLAGADVLGDDELISALKAAFTVSIGQPTLRATLPDGTTQAVWPIDEPLRILRGDVAREALSTLAGFRQGQVRAKAFDPLGAAFDTFVQGRYSHAGGLGSYLTPASVAEAMAQISLDLLGRPPVGLIGDPCCGTGRFLAAVIAESRRRHPRRDVMKRIVAADQSPASVAMARVNMFAYGASAPRVFSVLDSIIDPSLDAYESEFELILTNPPFGDAKYDDPRGIDRTSRVLTALHDRSRIDPCLAFVARCITLLKPGGVAGIILPDGALDSGSMRSALLANRKSGIHALGVVSFPTVTFVPGGTTAKTSALFIQKGGDKPKSVFIARAEHVGYVKQGSKIVPDPDGDDLPTIAREIRAIVSGREGRTSHTRHVARVNATELESLDASTYDINALEARDDLLRTGSIELSKVLSEHRTKRSSRIRADLPFVSVLHVDNKGVVDWHAALSHRPVTPGIIAPRGSVIVSLLNPRKFRAAAVPDDYDEIQCSAEFGVFIPKIDAYAAVILLHHPLVRAQIAPLGKGTSSSRRRMSESDLLAVLAPQFTPRWEKQVGASARRLYETLAAEQRELNAILGVVK